MGKIQRASLDGFLSILTTVEIVLLSILFVWTVRLRQLKCRCAITETLDLMQVMMILVLIMVCIPDGIPYIGYIHLFSYPIIAIYLWSSYMYIRDLENENNKDCKCSDDIGRKTLKYLIIAQAIVFIFAIVINLSIKMHDSNKNTEVSWISATTPYREIRIY